MNLSQMLERLMAFGMTETQISNELKISQSAINKIRRGAVKDTMYSTACGIEKLYRLTLIQNSNANEFREKELKTDGLSKKEETL